MASRAGVSRLTEILNSTGDGGFGSIAGAIGGRAREIADIRGLLFGRQGTNSTGLGQSLGRAIFGAGYSATSARSPRRSTPAVTGAGGESSSKVEDLLGQANSKLKIIARTAIAQNQMNRDVNIIRQNVVLMTKKMTGKSKTSTDGYFYDAKQREAEYEKQYKQSESERNPPAAPGAPAAPARNGFGLGSVLKFVAGTAAIFLLLKNIDTIVNTFKNLNEKIKGWKDTWDKFDMLQWFKDITPEWLGTQITRLTNFFNGKNETFDALVDKIPTEKLGELISAVTGSFMSMLKTIGNKLIDAVSTMDSDSMFKLAEAAGIMALLMGPKGLVIGLLTSIFTLIGTMFTASIAGMGAGSLALVVFSALFGGLIGKKIYEAYDAVMYGSDFENNPYAKDRKVPIPYGFDKVQADRRDKNIFESYTNQQYVDAAVNSGAFGTRSATVEGQKELFSSASKMSPDYLIQSIVKLNEYNRLKKQLEEEGKLDDDDAEKLKVSTNYIKKDLVTRTNLSVNAANVQAPKDTGGDSKHTTSWPMPTSPRLIGHHTNTNVDAFGPTTPSNVAKVNSSDSIQNKIAELNNGKGNRNEVLIFKSFKDAGFSDEQSLAAVANAYRESSFKSGAIGDGKESVGLFQFNFAGGAGTQWLKTHPGSKKEDFYDPQYNINAMIELAKGSQGYGFRAETDFDKANMAFATDLERPASTANVPAKATEWLTGKSFTGPIMNQLNSGTGSFNLPGLINGAGELSEHMITIINNITNNAMDAGKKALNDLSSNDMETIKDFINPIMMKHTLTYF